MRIFYINFVLVCRSKIIASCLETDKNKYILFVEVVISKPRSTCIVENYLAIVEIAIQQLSTVGFDNTCNITLIRALSILNHLKYTIMHNKFLFVLAQP
jgi:hypothetical protein